MSLIQSNQFFEMQSALEHYNEHRTTLKMTTGSANLDSLTDGIQLVSRQLIISDSWLLELTQSINVLGGRILTMLLYSSISYDDEYYNSISYELLS